MGSVEAKRKRPVRVKEDGAALQTVDAAELLRRIYLLGVALCVIVTASATWGGEVRIATLGGSSSVLFLLLYLLAKVGRVNLAGILGTGLFLCLLLVAIVTGHGIRDISFAGFTFVILLANLVLDSRSAQFASFATWLLAVSTASAEYLGLYQSDLSSYTTLHSVVVIAVLYLGIVLACRLLVRAYHQSLRRAQVQEQSYRHLFDATTEAIFVIDPNTKRVIDVNRSATTMFGFSQKELLGSSIEELAGSHQSFAEFELAIKRAMVGEPSQLEWSATDKFGSPLATEVRLTPATVGDKNVLLAVIRDTTESRSHHDQFREGEKLQAVGQLAGGIAHDFNNQLTGILANATLLHDKLQDERLKKCAEVIVRCSRRSSDLTAQLLAFARRGKHQNVRVNLHELILEVVALLEHTIDKRINLETILSQESLTVQGDPTLLQNALLNLGLNARDAMPHGGTLSFEAHRRLIEVTRTGLSASLIHGEYAQIVVKDTGIGMDEATRKQIFDPFFTTKETGNGMGLAAVYGAVESHRGDISVSSRLGAGTSFTLLLPLSENSQDSVSLKKAPSPRRFDKTRILVAEDDPDVALSTVALLEEMGFEVTLCKDGREALDTFVNAPESFDVVLVDHMMPRLTGREALSQMHELSPGFPAIITSGFSNEAVIDEGDEAAVFLPKPFNQERLGAAIARALAKVAEPQELSGSTQ